MEVIDLRLRGLKLVRPHVFRDHRGVLVESFHAVRYAEHGIDCAFVQDNHSRSCRATLRGIHLQLPGGQAKLVRVASGKIFDVAVDLRPDSPTFGQWEAVEIDAEQHEQLFMPAGFAHGFCVLSETADVLYKLSAAYDPALECTLAYDDPDLSIAWPVDEPILSERDRHGLSLAALYDRMKAGSR